MFCEKSGSDKKGPSLSCDETSLKMDPLLSGTQLPCIDLQVIEQNIIITLKNRAKYESYWHNVNSNCKNSLCALLGL